MLPESYPLLIVLTGYALVVGAFVGLVAGLGTSKILKTSPTTLSVFANILCGCFGFVGGLVLSGSADGGKNWIAYVAPIGLAVVCEVFRYVRWSARKF